MSGCAEAATGTDPKVLSSMMSAASGQAQAAGAPIIDVRTPSEYAAGHLKGAVNIDVDSPTFDARVSQLPKGPTYVVYCRSGNRSARAAQRMSELGFASVTDAGSMSEAAADTGLPVVQ